MARNIKLEELKPLIIQLQQGKDVAEIVYDIRTTVQEHRRVRCRERRLVIDTPVVVRTLADSEDLILQRVGVVTDDTDLDVDAGTRGGRGGHLRVYLFGYA